jgi:hypothetical protein
MGMILATLVIAKCGKLKALSPCAMDGFMSNIKMFPNDQAFQAGHSRQIKLRAPRFLNATV